MKKIKKTIIALILGVILGFSVLVVNRVKAKADTIWEPFGTITDVSLIPVGARITFLERPDNINTTSAISWRIGGTDGYSSFITTDNIDIFSINYTQTRYVGGGRYYYIFYYVFPNDNISHYIYSSHPNTSANLFPYSVITTHQLQGWDISSGTPILNNTNSLILDYLNNSTKCLVEIPQTTYSITFNANGGTGTPPASVEVEPGSHYTIPGNTTNLTREGYNFIGWNTTSTATTGATSLSNIISDITLYAIWQIQQFTITFNANGGTGTPPAQTLVNYGANYTIPGNTTGLTRQNYHFIGWNTFSDATGGLTTLSNITSNRTLYAIWAPDTYTITFNANGGTGTPPAQLTLEYGTTFNIPGNTTNLTREGYTFQGWNTSSTAQTGLTQIIIETNITIYAIWRIDRSDILKIYLNDNLVGQYSIITTGTSAHYMIAFDGFDIALFELYLNGGELAPQYQSTSYILSSNMNNIVFTLSGENIYTLLIYNNDTLEYDWTYDDLVENGTAYIHFYNGGDVDIKIYTRQGINTDTESLINTFKMLFKGANEILNIRFGWITIGGILAIVLSIGVIFFIFKLIRGGL